MRSSAVRIRVLLFGRLRELAGDGGERDIAAPATVRSLLDALVEENVLPAALLERSAVAVNREYAAAERELADGDEVAVLPPVSGGRKQ